MEFPCAKYNKKNIHLRKKCVEFLSEMMRNEKNMQIHIEGYGVVLGHNHITSYMNSKHKF